MALTHHICALYVPTTLLQLGHLCTASYQRGLDRILEYSIRWQLLHTLRLSEHRGMGAQHQRPSAHKRPAITQAMVAVSVTTVVVI